MKSLLLLVVMCFVLKAFSQSKKKVRISASTIHLAFTNRVGEKIIDADSVYLNTFNEPFTVTQLKYYITNISFGNAAGKEVKIPNSYFLVNEADSASKVVTIATSLPKIVSINFYLGVDSIKNVSGVQTGVLDPLNGMFWTWSTGYIMAKLEATSPLSNAPQQRVTYHIGGFANANNVVKKITLKLSDPLTLQQGGAATININADINKWFSGEATIKIAEHNFCMNPGDLANKIAANYVNMFSIDTLSLSH